MKKNVIILLPFLIMPMVIPFYLVLDNLILVNVFGCGCVPSVQTNMLNIPFNANDLRLTVFTILTIGLSGWGIGISKRFDKKIIRFLYCAAVLTVNGILTMWVVKTFMWA